MSTGNKKGQAALEYLMTYGWAILVILAVTVVLMQWGILDLAGSQEPDPFGFSGLIVEDYTIHNSSMSLYLLNQYDRNLTLNSVSIKIIGHGTYTYNTTHTIPSSAGYMVNISNQIFNNYPGEKHYRVDPLVLNYTDSKTGLSHISSGFLWGSY